MKIETVKKSQIQNRLHIRKGFTLVEVVVGSAVFLLIALAAYEGYISLFKLIDLSQYRVLAVSLANEQFETARNMPYNDVGIVDGLPIGKIPSTQTVERGGVSFTVKTIVRNIDLPFDGTLGGVPNDTSPADNKLVEVQVSCMGCRGLETIKLSTSVAPKNLETASTNGALFIKVFNADGQPVQGASVNIVNVATTSSLVIDDVTDAGGELQLVDVPPGDNAYRITVTKAGYSSDRTYPPGDVSNPSPLKADVTVLLQQVTQISFSIDELSSLSISSVGPTCATIGDFDFALTGSKMIGEDIPKYSENLETNASGLLVLDPMEWDGYSFESIDVVYDLAGLSPLNSIVLNPGATQEVQIVAVPKLPKSLLVTVKDGSTGLPMPFATTTLSGLDSEGTRVTGKGYFNQTDWSGGSGQASMSNQDSYWADDNNIDTSSFPGEIRLASAFGSYSVSAWLESSTFDSGSVSNFHSLVWSPGDQPPLAGNDSVRFQVASNSEVTATTTWDYSGPDGTASTYYTSPLSSINQIHNGNRYFRYKVYLTTEDTTVTPNISDIGFTFTSSCTPPGQVIFSSLQAGVYRLIVSKDGYATFDQDIDVITDWQEYEVMLSP